MKMYLGSRGEWGNKLNLPVREGDWIQSRNK